MAGKKKKKKKDTYPYTFYESCLEVCAFLNSAEVSNSVNFPQVLITIFLGRLNGTNS